MLKKIYTLSKTLMGASGLLKNGEFKNLVAVESIKGNPEEFVNMEAVLYDSDPDWRDWLNFIGVSVVSDIPTPRRSITNVGKARLVLDSTLLAMYLAQKDIDGLKVSSKHILDYICVYSTGYSYSESLMSVQDVLNCLEEAASKLQSSYEDVLVDAVKAIDAFTSPKRVPRDIFSDIYYEDEIIGLNGAIKGFSFSTQPTPDVTVDMIFERVYKVIVEKYFAWAEKSMLTKMAMLNLRKSGKDLDNLVVTVPKDMYIPCPCSNVMLRAYYERIFVPSNAADYKKLFGLLYYFYKEGI